MFKLRWYQEEAVASIYKYFTDNNGNPIVALPTGTGKSIVIADFIKKALTYYPNQRIMMLTHVKELIEQNFDKLLRLWPTAPAGIYSAGLKRKENANPITFAGIASVAKKPKLFGRQDLLIVDECHLVSHRANTMYLNFINALKELNPYLKVIGLTATQYRLGQGLLTDGGLFTDTCYDLTSRESFARLVKENFIAPLITKRTNAELDVSHVKINGGDFVLKQLQESVNKTNITRAALEEVLALGKNRKSWLIFTTGIQHAEDTARMLNTTGIKTAAIHSKINNSKRDDIINGFKNGVYQAVTNNNVLSTGFDHPEIDLIAVLRPTISTGLWVQLLGRGTRPAPGKDNCLVLDFAGNTRRLGPIDDPVIPKKKRGELSGTAPVKVCEQCSFYNHTSVRFCVNCGYEFHRESKLKTSASTQAVMGAILPAPKKKEPKIVIFSVDSVIYAKHSKSGKPDSLKITYHCGLRVFNEWVCLEHPGYAGRKASEWWNSISKNPPPKTVEDALQEVERLRVPNAIKVWVNKKYPEVMGRVYGSQPS